MTKNRKQLARNVAMSSKPELKLDWCSHQAAKYAVEKWHYSRRMPKSKLAKIGVWEEGQFVGVVIFGVGATADLVKGYGLDKTQGCELVRVALTRHSSPVSRIISVATRMIRKSFPNLRLCVSFADIGEGHHGGIYQAGNWVYSGLANDKGGSVVVKGKQMHGRSCGLKYGTRSITWIRKNVDPDAKAAETKGKHRYLMPFDDEMRKQIEPLRKPYPKRVRSVDSDTSADPG